MTVRTIRVPRPPHRPVGTALLHALDGSHPWGTASSSLSRYGAVHETVTILPPDTTPARRRWVSALHAAPPAALMLTLVLGCVGIGVAVPWHAAFGAPAALGAAAWLVCWREASPATRSAVQTTAWCSALVVDAEADAAVRRVRRIVHRLQRAEDGVRAGLLPASALQEEWRDAYELVGRLERLVR
ncbi:DUF6611 family protein [Agrococcus sp. SGAir0287]|uniref:DUF6611 family protein n=1 Tax=Agrococcus sp. SGAir0287 TaxID=2070347 RepID=UPI0010CCF8E4|nr:DUF6611 family protein [Agrococcus sp. SGAir0287]QCR19532.1 hypothetical protein C1N71_08910 [Agrococcus sp. SGAir0287]